MIQRLVTSDPSPDYVRRVAARFANNGQGVRGDLAAVFQAILLDEEARGRAGLDAPWFGKVREPMVRLAQWARTFKLTSVSGTWKMARPTYVAQYSLGQSPLQAPSVFNFFRPGYVPPSTALAQKGATAPEFQILNESTIPSFINYLQLVIYKGIYILSPELPYVVQQTSATDAYDLVPDYSTELALAHDAEALLSRLNLLLCAHQLNASTIELIRNALLLDPVKPDGTAHDRRIQVARALMLVMCSANYLVQK
jgi:hypothetical protein